MYLKWPNPRLHLLPVAPVFAAVPAIPIANQAPPYQQAFANHNAAPVQPVAAPYGQYAPPAAYAAPAPVYHPAAALNYNPAAAAFPNAGQPAFAGYGPAYGVHPPQGPPPPQVHVPHAPPAANICYDEGHDFDRFYHSKGWNTQCSMCTTADRWVNTCAECGLKVCWYCTKHRVD
jgi:hypothetical protein